MRSSVLSLLVVAGSVGVLGSGREPSPSATAPSTLAATSWLHTGSPDITSAGALAFTPDGLLLVGDSPASAVFALDVADGAVSRLPSDTINIAGIDGKIAARLGTTVGEITINDMAVHPRSHAIYFSVTRGHGTSATPVILRVGMDRVLTPLSFDKVAFAKTVIPNPPAQGAKDQDGDDAFGRSITGLTVAGGQLYVAGLTNDEFSSTLRRIPLPFGKAMSSTGMRFFHSHHSRYETKAPVTALAPYSEGGREYLVVSYACTPLVMFPINELTDGAKVTGKTIAELGAGTSARDVVPYEYKGRHYLAISTRHRSLQMVMGDSLAAAPAIDEKWPRPKTPQSSWNTWGVEALTVAQPGVLHLADFNADYVVAVQRNPETGLMTLRPIKKPILWP